MAIKRILCIMLIICSFNINVNGQSGISDSFSRLSFGAEWSYIGTVHYSSWYNYFSTDGYRVDKDMNAHGYWNNAETLLHVGYNFSPHWNLSLYTGVSGFADIHNAIPVSIRATYCFGDDPLKDRWLTFMDIGTGVSIKTQPQEIWTCKIGGGYRITLSRDTKLDFIASFRLTCTHPQVIDSGEVIALEWINMNLALLQSFSIGMSITF